MAEKLRINTFLSGLIGSIAKIFTPGVRRAAAQHNPKFAPMSMKMSCGFTTQLGENLMRRY